MLARQAWCGSVGAGAPLYLDLQIGRGSLGEGDGGHGRYAHGGVEIFGNWKQHGEARQVAPNTMTVVEDLIWV